MPFECSSIKKICFWRSFEKSFSQIGIRIRRVTIGVVFCFSNGDWSHFFLLINILWKLLFLLFFFKEILCLLNYSCKKKCLLLKEWGLLPFLFLFKIKILTRFFAPLFLIRSWHHLLLVRVLIIRIRTFLCVSHRYTYVWMYVRICVRMREDLHA